jgi:hypothetical protein
LSVADFASGGPAFPPSDPPSCCTSCGAPYPRNSWTRRAGRFTWHLARTPVARVWTEFKNLSFLHLIVLILLFLLLIGALTWHDLVDILKPAVQK